MEFKKEITIKLTPEEVKEIIIEKLKTEGIEIENIDFRIRGKSMPGDHFSERPLIYELNEVLCKYKY